MNKIYVPKAIKNSYTVVTATDSSGSDSGLFCCILTVYYKSGELFQCTKSMQVLQECSSMPAGCGLPTMWLGAAH